MKRFALVRGLTAQQNAETLCANIHETLRCLFELIRRLDELNGWPGSLDCALGDLHAWDFPLEPKPTVIRSIHVNLGKKTGPVLELLRRRGHTVVGDEVIVKYPPGSDPYIGTQAADLELEIHAAAEDCGYAGEDFTEKLTVLHGLGPQSC